MSRYSLILAALAVCLQALTGRTQADEPKGEPSSVIGGNDGRWLDYQPLALTENSDGPPAATSQATPAPPTSNQSKADIDETREDEFRSHFAPYEPMYFVGGPQAPTIKFQFSLRYQLLAPNAPPPTWYPWLKDLNFAYSQTSLWDWSDPDHPYFYDSSYRPEVFYFVDPHAKAPQDMGPSAQFGFGHESNGKQDPDHRSLDIIFVRPMWSLTMPDKQFVRIEPKFYDYFDVLSENHDIAKYRGYCDMRVSMGRDEFAQLAAIGRLGSTGRYGSIQIDLTYPTNKLPLLPRLKGTDLCLDLQYFSGYGDSLLGYNQRTSVLRIGFCLQR